VTSERSDYSIIIPTPLSGDLRLGVAIEAKGITCMEFLSRDTPLRCGETPLERGIEDQLTSYFQNPSTPSDIPLHPLGTPYQQCVWRALRQIPVGATTRYGELAERLASGPRAVAAACRANPIPILIPCHRVVAKDGLGGYMGAMEGEAMLIKRWLLHHEGALRK